VRCRLLPNPAGFLRVHGLAFGALKRLAELFEVLDRVFGHMIPMGTDGMAVHLDSLKGRRESWLYLRVGRAVSSRQPASRPLSRSAETDQREIAPMSFQAYLANIKAKTGKTPKDFARLAKGESLAKHGEIVNWLKSEYSVGHGHASAIAGVVLRMGGPKMSTGDKMSSLFGGKKQRWPLPVCSGRDVRRDGPPRTRRRRPIGLNRTQHSRSNRNPGLFGTHRGRDATTI
jgi:hypothetical protein